MNSSIEGSSDPAVRYAVDEGEPVAAAVCRAAERAGVDVTRSERVLYDVLDGAALDRLFRDDGDDAAVSFRLWGLYVVVRPSEVVVYEEPVGEDAD